MRHTDEGLELTKSEIAALLAFACDAPERPNLYGVHFLLSEQHIRARATNGHVALDAVGTNETGTENEWFVHRDFLKGATKVLENNCTITLQFSGASLRDAAVHDQDGVERATFSWPQDAANAQTTFPDQSEWDRLLTPPSGKRSVKFVKLNAEYLGMMAKVAKAAGMSWIDCYPPPKQDDLAVFRVEGVDTTWIAVVAPMKGDEEEEV